ncbi:MAG: hypothetical protein R3336_09240, partial [Phycisphaeraceae bacterium]|nr:hypothetical protein [Phycisphaeraceae bacterium]
MMPGRATDDFGDLVRTVVSPTEEDEPDASKVHFRPEMYEALITGYLEGAGDVLSDAEIRH